MLAGTEGPMQCCRPVAPLNLTRVLKTIFAHDISDEDGELGAIDVFSNREKVVSSSIASTRRFSFDFWSHTDSHSQRSETWSPFGFPASSSSRLTNPFAQLNRLVCVQVVSLWVFDCFKGLHLPNLRLLNLSGSSVDSIRFVEYYTCNHYINFKLIVVSGA